MGEVQVVKLQPGESREVDPESPAARAAARIHEKHKAAATTRAATHQAAADPKKKGPGQGARRCGRCGGTWEPRSRGAHERGYHRICIGCNRTVALCDCAPDPYRTGKNEKHLEDRRQNQRQVRSGTKRSEAVVHVTKPALATVPKPGHLDPDRKRRVLLEAADVLQEEQDLMTQLIAFLKKRAGS